MKSAIRVTGPSAGWQLVAPSASESGSLDAVRLCLEFPAFLDAAGEGGDVGRIAVLAPGSSTGRVLVSVDGDGRVMLAACPEESESADTSALVADVLATAGRLWHQPYEVLLGVLDAALGAPAVEKIASVAGPGHHAEFRAGVERSLNQGRFPVAVIARRKTKPVEDMLHYLVNMNFPATLLGYRCSASSKVEFVVPVPSQVVPVEPARPQQAAGVSAAPSPQAQPPRFTPQWTPPAQSPAPVASRPEPARDKLTDKQREIVDILAGLDDLKLERRGLEYFIPGVSAKETTEGTIVVAVAPDRWPFPKPDEVIVVVNAAQEHLAGYLRVSPEDIRDFLGSLPREEKREHKGCVLLRASNVSEALQLVNELKALKEVSVGGVGG